MTTADKTTTTEPTDLFDSINYFLSHYDASLLDHDQDNFILYLELARLLSWDIPSALACDHLTKEVPMHRPDFDTSPSSYFHSWDYLDNHFKDIHGLDLTDSRINWSFDT